MRSRSASGPGKRVPNRPKNSAIALHSPCHSCASNDLRRDIQLDTEITSMVFDDDRQVWTVTSADGGE